MSDAVRSRFDEIERAIMESKMTKEQVFTQMKKAALEHAGRITCQLYGHEVQGCGECTPPAAVVPEGFIEHLNSVIGGVLASCEPKQSSEENQYIGGQALEELSRLELELAQMLGNKD